MPKNPLFKLVMTSVAALLCTVARADLYTAYHACDQKDHAKAFELFRELAELGQVNAQEQIADMYVAGEGVKRDNLRGYAWAQIAKENGSKQTQTILDQLEPHLAPKAREMIDAIRAKFGPVALRKRVRRAGIQGSVYMEFTVMPDGHARNPRVVYSVPVKVFDKAARAAVLNTEFTPATTKGVPEPCQYATMIRYVTRDGQEDFPKLMQFVKETKIKSDAGDAPSQMLYGLLAEGLPQMSKSRREAMPAFLKAAHAGVPTRSSSQAIARCRVGVASATSPRR